MKRAAKGRGKETFLPVMTQHHKDTWPKAKRCAHKCKNFESITAADLDVDRNILQKQESFPYNSHTEEEKTNYILLQTY